MYIKKTAILALILLSVCFLPGCKSPSEVAAEKAGEKIIENATGNKIDIDGDKMTIEGEDGTQITMGDNKWPTDKLAKEIPQMEKGTVYYVANTDDFWTIMLNEVKESDFEDYLAKVESAGFSAEKTVYSDAANSIYTAKNDKGISIQLNYDLGVEGLSFTVVKEEPNV